MDSILRIRGPASNGDPRAGAPQHGFIRSPRAPPVSLLPVVFTQTRNCYSAVGSVRHVDSSSTRSRRSVRGGGRGGAAFKHDPVSKNHIPYHRHNVERWINVAVIKSSRI